MRLVVVSVTALEQSGIVKHHDVSGGCCSGNRMLRSDPANNELRVERRQ